MIVTVIGLGLIGGSMALDLRRRGFASRVLGVEADRVNADAALQLGLVDELVPFEEGVDRADLVVVAVPVGAAVRMLPSVLDRFSAGSEASSASGGSDCKCGKVVIDVCSTKEALVKAVHYHPLRAAYVATHPMAGTEYSGPHAAMTGLFDGNACIICNSEDSSPRAVRVVEKLYDVLNMRRIFMNAANHDVHTAYVSHISHITSFALALTVLDKEKDEKHIFDLASGGFSSTVRLAKSNPDTWVPILLENSANVLQVIDTYIDKISAFRSALASLDGEEVRALIGQANRIKRIIR
ncbi:MAG: prephenate dehydrogenase [Bacteroidales bacterium]|nr:prephenate dehydrogenase [Bacteroidales bacterium]